MKVFFLLGVVFGLSSAEYCFDNIASLCSVGGDGVKFNCSAKFSGVHQVMPELSRYVLHHIDHSFQHLLMATNFANFEKNREGFSKLYRKLSDSSWEDALDLVKYITKRGGEVDFHILPPEEPNKKFEFNFEMLELESLSRALDMHKNLAEFAHKIHSGVTKHKFDYHDAETLSYIEEKFVEKHADVIRQLAGYTNDLSNLVQGNRDSSLAIYLFDEYLQKAA